MIVPQYTASTPRRGEFLTRRLNGGLNYASARSLTSSELRDGGDIDLFPSGAVGTRRALIPFTKCQIPHPVVAAWSWQSPQGVDYMFIELLGGEIKMASRVNDAGDITDCFVQSPFPNMVSLVPAHAWTAAGKLYVGAPNYVHEWDGVAAASTSVITSTIHPMTVTPQATNQGVPGNFTAATYRDVVFIGGVTITGEDPDAVAWSTAVAERPVGEPLAGQIAGQKDFFENQRITFIGGRSAEGIIKLVAAGPSLYAFKPHSVHAIATNGTTVLSNDLSTQIGLAGFNAVCATNGTVFFFDENEGLHVIEGASTPKRIFDPIFPLLECGRIRNVGNVAVGYDGGKVFVSCALDTDGANNVTFVLNTNLQALTPGGAWAKWDVGFSAFEPWVPARGGSGLVGFTTKPVAAVRVNECSDSSLDDYGFVKNPVRPWFKTAFFDDSIPTAAKVWGKPSLDLSGSGVARISVGTEAGEPIAVPGEPRCETPGGVGMELSRLGWKPVEATLTEDCDTDCLSVGEGWCFTDSRGGQERAGYVCGDQLKVDEGTVRVAELQHPGTGVAFAASVRDNGSTGPWQITQLSARYRLTQECE